MRLIRTAYEAAVTAAIVGAVFMLPLFMSVGTLFSLDMLGPTQIQLQIGSGSGERFAHIELPAGGDPGGGGGGGAPEYFGEEKKIAGEYDLTPQRADPEPIGTAAARAALERSYATPRARRGGPAAGYGVGSSTGTYRDDGTEMRERGAAIAGRRDANRKCDEPLPGIRHLGGDNYAVERQIVDFFTSDVGAVQQVVGVRWYRDDRGRIEGFQVGNIRCGSPLDQLGIRNGDVVLRINGRPVRSLVAALGVLGKLHRNDRVHVEIDRRGKPVQRFVTIR